MTKLPELFNTIQCSLFPDLEEILGELNSKHKEFIRAIELIDLEKYTKLFQWKRIGCKPHNRESILKSLIAKSIFNIKHTRGLVCYLKSSSILRRLCGWENLADIPSESTFSRAFNSFSNIEVGNLIHNDLITENLSHKIIGHASKDATSVAGREKSCRKNAHGKKHNKKRGRPAKGVVVEKEPRRLELQPHRTLKENLDDLPNLCDWGTKKTLMGKGIHGKDINSI